MSDASLNPYYDGLRYWQIQGVVQDGKYPTGHPRKRHVSRGVVAPDVQSALDAVRREFPEVVVHQINQGGTVDVVIDRAGATREGDLAPERAEGA